jgi:hypothetical protein
VSSPVLRDLLSGTRRRLFSWQGLLFWLSMMAVVHFKAASETSWSQIFNAPLWSAVVGIGLAVLLYLILLATEAFRFWTKPN